MQGKEYIRLNLNPKYTYSNLYITTKDFLKPKDQNKQKQKLEQLALMDIVAIINLKDDEVLYKDIPHLNPTTIEKCQKFTFFENQGAVKLIDDVLKVQQKSVAIFCDADFSKSHLLLICYLIYNDFKFLQDITKLDSIENRLCEINFKSKEISLENNKLNIQRELYGNKQLPNYRFKTTMDQISDALKFQQTKILSTLTFNNNNEQDLRYYLIGDNPNIRALIDRYELSNLYIQDPKQHYYEKLEEIKDDKKIVLLSAIVLKK